MRPIDADRLKEDLTRFYDGEVCARNLIDEQPSAEPEVLACGEGELIAEPERKTGRWIEFPNHNAFKCSECGRLILTTDGKNNVLKHYPYCHCGAKMEVDS